MDNASSVAASLPNFLGSTEEESNGHVQAAAVLTSTSDIDTTAKVSEDVEGASEPALASKDGLEDISDLLDYDLDDYE